MQERGDGRPEATVHGPALAWAAIQPGAAAISAPGRSPLSYDGLAGLIDTSAAQLNAAGVGLGDTVVTVLPQGPEAATAFLCVTATATCAPLNPALTEAEIRALLTDLAPKLVITAEGLDSGIRTVAKERDLPLVELRAGGAAGAFALDFLEDLPATGTQESAKNRGRAGDAALVLHTSGTTARPKLVPLTHANLAASAGAVARTVQLTPADRCLGVMPWFHIHGLVAALLASLHAGASVSCPPTFAPDDALDWLEAEAATWYTAVPTMHQALLAATRARSRTGRSWTTPRLRTIRSSSAALPTTVLHDLEETFGVPVIEAYGMTEAAHQMACNPLPPALRKPGTVGVAAGPDVAIMDAAGTLLPVGATGEVVVRGPSITAGYLDNPAANAGSFVDDWFRTGDEGVLDDEGYLTLTGRLKEMINRGGEKIAPREIDEVLLGHPSVAEAVTFAVPHGTLGEEVAAAVVLADDTGDVTESALREFAGDRLAPFKIPRRIVFVDAIPKGPTGKLQRIGLAEQLGLIAGNGTTATAMSPNELSIASLWEATLGRDGAGLDDDFFLAGGDSLSALELVAAIRAALGVDLPLEAVFTEHATIRRMAAAVALARSIPEPPSTTYAATGPAPLSSAHERLWFHQRLFPDRPTYNATEIVWLRGPHDVGALRAATTKLGERHEALRTVVRTVDGRLAQEIADVPVVLRVLERDGIGHEHRWAEAHEFGRADGGEPFDLSVAPLMRATLLRFADDDAALVLTVHHAAGDGPSREILRHDLAMLYNAFASGKPAELPVITVTAAQAARRQSDRLARGALDSDVAYWRDVFTPLPPIAELPADRRPPPVSSQRGGRVVTDLGAATSEQLRAFARARGVTLFMALTAAFATLLRRCGGLDDMVIGTPVAGRLGGGLEHTAGCFTNTVAIRLTADAERSVASLVNQVRQAALGAFAHQEAPWDVVVAAVQPERSLAHEPLCQVMIELTPPRRGGLLFDGLDVEVDAVDLGTAKFDLTLEIEPIGESMRATLEYNGDRFDRSTAERLAGMFAVVIGELAADADRRVSDIRVLTPDQEREMLLLGMSDDEPLPAATLVDLVAQQADRTPDAVALDHRGERYTYAQLDEAANRLAHHLITRGVASEAPVGVLLDRSPDIVIAILAILKAGGTYVPLEPTFPDERLAFMLDDVDAAMVVSTDRYAARLPADLPVVNLDAEAGAIATGAGERPTLTREMSHAAYVIYTSGSTGRPKGVVIENSSAVDFVRWGLATFTRDELDRVLFATSICFDISVFEIFVTLAAGGTLVLVENVLALIDSAEATRATLINTVPSAMAEIIRADAVPSSAHTVMLVGEPLTPDLAEAVLGQPAVTRLVNAYGPTETTVYATYAEIDTTNVIAPTIGRPKPNTCAVVLDGSGRPAPLGVPGELYLGGAGVAREYRNRPDLTAERFVVLPDIAGAARLYRTGDLVRWRADGNLDFLGRTDFQVKVRGHRVEPGEIDAALKAHPTVVEAVTVARTALSGGNELVAYVVDNGEQSAAALQMHLRRSLLDHMVPDTFVFLERLPRGATGKVDRNALPDPPAAVARASAVAPRNPAEEAIAQIFCAVLGTDSVGVHDDFFDLGGHSLLAVQLATELEKALGVEIPLARLFQGATVSSFAGDAGSSSAPIIDLASALRVADGPGPPLFCVITWMRAAPQFRRLGRHLESERQTYMVLGQHIDEQQKPLVRVEDMAALALTRIRAAQPSGPYTLCGYSLGGVVAFEVAQQLRALGEDVDNLIIIDAQRHPGNLRFWLGRLGRMRSLSPRGYVAGLRRMHRRTRRRLDARRGFARIDPARPEDRRAAALRLLDGANKDAYLRYRPDRWPGSAVILRSTDNHTDRGGDALRWDHVIDAGNLRIEAVPGGHVTVLEEPNVTAVADVLRRLLSRD